MTPKSKVASYFELMKPGLSFLVVISAVMGLYLGLERSLPVPLLLHLFAGVFLAAGGANALNQWLEGKEDALMQRTRVRPLPEGRLRPGQVFYFGLVCSVAGTLYIFFLINPLTALLSLASSLSYLFVYTPLKKLTSLCTIAGAVPGAIPILMGWAASGRGLNHQAWVLFFIMFLWQFPHFLAIAWLCREDYAKAGFVMLTAQDPEGQMVGYQIVLYTLALLAASLISTLVGLTGKFYFFGALAIGLAFLGFGISLALARSRSRARRVMFASIIYLPVLQLLMVLDKALL